MRNRDTEDEPHLIAYSKAGEVLRIEPAARTRAWMESLPSHFAYRCLPLVIANQAGWFLLNNRPFEAVWKGRASQDSLRIKYDRGNGSCWACSHFGYGILTFTLPFLFRTSPGTDLLVRGPSNLPKDGISALEGIVETSWAVAPFTMNWKFTRPHHRVRFELDEPIAMLVPVQLDHYETLDTKIRSLDDDARLKESFLAWRSSRADFIEGRHEDPKIRSQVWQKHYFMGTSPDGRLAHEHRQKLRLKRFEPNS